MWHQSRSSFWQLRLLNNIFHHDTVTWWKMHRRSIDIQADQRIKKKTKPHTGVGEYKHEDGHLLLQLNEDLRSGVAHQTLLDLSQQKLLHWNFPALHKELLVEFSYNLWNFILSNNNNKQMISVTKTDEWKQSEQQPQAPCWRSLAILPAPRSRSELSYPPAPCKLWNAACKLDCRGCHQTARSRCYEKRRTKFHCRLSDWSPLKVTVSWPSESEGHRRHQSRLPLRSHSWALPADGFASHTASLRQWADWCIVSYLWPWVNPPSWLPTLYLFALTQVKVTENNVKVGGGSLYWSWTEPLWSW